MVRDGKEIILYPDTVVLTQSRDLLYRERAAYRRLNSLLGEASRLPKILSLRPLKNGRARLVMERIHGKRLADLARGDNQAVIEQTCRPHVEAVIDILEGWAHVRAPGDPILLIREIRESIANRLDVAQTLAAEFFPPSAKQRITRAVQRRLDELDDVEMRRLARGIPHLSPAHKDMTRGNIFVQPDGYIRFIDPFWVLTGATTVSPGHVLIDLQKLGFVLGHMWDPESDRRTANANLSRLVARRTQAWIQRQDNADDLEQIYADLKTQRYLGNLCRVPRPEQAARLALALIEHLEET